MVLWACVRTWSTPIYPLIRKPLRIFSPCKIPGDAPSSEKVLKCCEHWPIFLVNHRFGTYIDVAGRVCSVPTGVLLGTQVAKASNVRDCYEIGLDIIGV